MHLNLLFFKIKYTCKHTQNDTTLKKLYSTYQGPFSIFTPVCEIICKFEVNRMGC